MHIPPQTPEQAEVQRQLIAEYGVKTYVLAHNMAALKNVLQLLRMAEPLTKEEGEQAYVVACLHLGAIFDALVPDTAESARIAECGNKIDSAVDQQVLDNIERRDGLPPMPKLP